MVKDPGTRHSWGRRLISASAAAAVGLLGVALLLFVLSQFNGATRSVPEWLILTALLLTFLGVGYLVYRHLGARDHYVVLAVLYTLPVIGLISFALLPERSHYDDYPGDAPAMTTAPSEKAESEVAAVIVEAEQATSAVEAEVPKDAVAAKEDPTATAESAAAAATRAEEAWRRAAMERARRERFEELSRAEEQLAEAAPREPAMPRFPWPPPKASGMEVLPTVFLRDQVTLGDVAVALDRALSWIGRHEIRFYSVPNGFAMVTRLEAIDEDGNTIADADRDQVDFLTYIRNLFWVPPGHYRMIVFVVTDQLFESSGAPLDRAQANALLSRGFNDLPQIDSARPYTEQYRTTALIYEFRKERQNEVARVLSPGRYPAYYHLDRIGWFAAALAMPQMADVAVLFASPTAAGRGGR